MAELFRYIQQAFVVPTATAAIDVARDSDLQLLLKRAATNRALPEKIRSIASEFLGNHFSSPVADPFQLSSPLRKLRGALLALPTSDQASVEAAVAGLFGSPAGVVDSSGPLQADKSLLDDSLVCVKLVSGFDRVNANDLLLMRRAVAYIDDLAAGLVTSFTASDISSGFARPVRIPHEFLDALKPPTQAPTPLSSSSPDSSGSDRASLLAEQQALRSAYETIMALGPHELELTTAPSPQVHPPAAALEPAASFTPVPPQAERESGVIAGPASAAPPAFLSVPRAVVERLGLDVWRALEQSSIDVLGAPVPQVISEIKRRWQEVSRQLAPFQIPAPSPVFRVGGHLFAIQPPTAAARALPAPSGPPLSAPRSPITRPIGVGDLQVVRQELQERRPAGELPAYKTSRSEDQSARPQPLELPVLRNTVRRHRVGLAPARRVRPDGLFTGVPGGLGQNRRVRGNRGPSVLQRLPDPNPRKLQGRERVCPAHERVSDRAVGPGGPGPRLLHRRAHVS